MISLPNDYENSWTLGGTVERTGVGLHSGNSTKVKLSPFNKSGFYLKWSDKNEPPIKLFVEQVRDSSLCTTLDLGERKLFTVEHLFAALAGCGVSHVLIEVTGSEIPLLDGSAKGWVDAIFEVGLIPVNTIRFDKPTVKKTLALSRGQSLIAVTPSDKFSLIGIIDFPYRAIGRQMFKVDLTPEKFVTEIAPARTFGFVDQIEQLRSSGLIKGGDLNNALVCNGDSWINPPLRFDDEPIRHKLLDLIGDLALVGFPKAQILVYKGSHGLHADLASALASENS